MEKEQLESELQRLEEQKSALQKSINAITKQKPEGKVLAALAEQRYYYLKEKPDVIFDRDTGYLWSVADFDTSLIQTVELTGSNLADAEEVEKLHDALKQCEFLSFQGWEIPEPGMLRQIIDGNSCYDDYSKYPGNLPQVGDKIYQKQVVMRRAKHLIALKTWYSYKDGYYYFSFKIEKHCIGKLIFNDQAPTENFIHKVRWGELTGEQFFLVNRSSVLEPIDPNFPRYSSNEKRHILRDRINHICGCTLSGLESASYEALYALLFFLTKRLVPVFDDHSVVEPFAILFDQLPELHLQLENLLTEEAALLELKRQQTELLSSTFDYRDLLRFGQFDCVAIDGSVVKFADATIRWTSLLEAKMTDYQVRKGDLVREVNQMTYALAQPYREQVQLSAEENRLFEARQQFMRERLSLNMSIPVAALGSMKAQCTQLKQQLLTVNQHPNSLYELRKISTQARPAFELVAENSAMMITDMLKKMEFYEANRDLVQELIRIEAAWCEDYQNISGREKLKEECREIGIEAEVYEGWLNEWAEKRWLVEQCLQPLMEMALRGGFDQHVAGSGAEYTLQLVALLEQYKQQLDQSYLEQRKDIHQKFAFQANSDAQEKFEAEIELYKQTLAFQKGVHSILFALDEVESRLWLLRWSEPLVSFSVDSILDFIRHKSLDQIARAVIDEFSELKMRNYITFINDAKAATEMMNAWDRDYHALMFKMRKSLNQPTQA